MPARWCGGCKNTDLVGPGLWEPGKTEKKIRYRSMGEENEKRHGWEQIEKKTDLV